MRPCRPQCELATACKRASRGAPGRFTDLFNEECRSQAVEQTQRKEARARIVEPFEYLKTALWSHYKMGLEFKSSDDPKALDEFKVGLSPSAGGASQRRGRPHLRVA